MAPVSFQMVMRSGPTPGKVFPLSKSEIYVGRDINNEIVVSDAEISRKHARLILQGGGYILEDLGSTNGSFVNGQRLMGPHPLRPGELVMFGENVGMVYEATQYDPNATVVGSGQVAMPPFEQPREAPSPVQAYMPPVQSYAPLPIGEPQSPAAMVDTPVVSERKGGCRRWLLAGCGCLIVLVCLIVVGVVVVYLVKPDEIENLICTGTLKPITQAILDLLSSLIGQSYTCPPL